jgi:hypothetical protein
MLGYADYVAYPAEDLPEQLPSVQGASFGITAQNMKDVQVVPTSLFKSAR